MKNVSALLLWVLAVQGCGDVDVGDFDRKSVEVADDAPWVGGVGERAPDCFGPRVDVSVMDVGTPPYASLVDCYFQCLYYDGELVEDVYVQFVEWSDGLWQTASVSVGQYGDEYWAEQCSELVEDDD